MVKNFTVGSDVEITTKWKSNLLWRDYDVNTFKGKVVPNPKWLDNDYVSVYTGNTEYPVSYIHKKFIVGFDMAENRSDLRIFKVKSKTKGSVYNVTSVGGKVSCDCVGFQFRRYCKHSDSVKKLLDKESA